MAKKIEVEQKYLLSDGQEERLLEGSHFMSQQNLIDIYFDNSDYSLTTKDRWLRQRNGKWNLKLPRNWPRTSTVNTYDELEQEEEICQALEILPHGNLKEDLKALGFLPFAKIETNRRSYAKGSFRIDLDTAYFSPNGDRSANDMYQIAEIEIIVENAEEITLVREEILRFATRQGLEAKFIRGKLIEFLFRFRPEHFQALIKAGVVVEEQTR